jgi:hypothetical protein
VKTTRTRQVLRPGHPAGTGARNVTIIRMRLKTNVKGKVKEDEKEKVHEVDKIGITFNNPQTSYYYSIYR